jgi:outer membrane protein OmpA-like peptidoglycan-associated protein
MKIKAVTLSRTKNLAIIFALLFSLLSAVGTTTTFAAGETISITTTSYSPGSAANVGVSLSGFNQSLSYQATVKFVNSSNEDVTNGTLAATQGSTTLISGYTSYSAAKLGFRGTYAQIAAALSSVTWNPSTASGEISIRIGIASAPATNDFYDANSARYYRYIPTADSWTSARTAAENTYLYGLRGYLAEINSSAENTFIGTETTATNVWIGATEDSATAASYLSTTYNGSAGQRWIWEGAIQTPLPDRSTTLSEKSGQVAQGPQAAYSSWSPNEPNNDTKPGQDCAVTNWGSTGLWNDLPCSQSNAYLIEFGGRAGETSTATTVTLTRTVEAINPRAISVAAIGGVTVPATGGTPVSTVTAANGYTGTVTWSPTGSPFAASTAYTATITLTAASSYTLTGVAANFFTLAGATSVTHSANSGVITAVFPATLAAPAFTLSPGDQSAIEGSAFIGYSITSTGGAIATYSISPAISNTPGLTFNSSTGRISGTPTTVAASRVYTITATNATGSASQTFALTVNPPPPPPPPNELKALTPPKISRDTTQYMCVAGTLLFLRNGSKEETPKITSQKYFLLQDGLTVDSVESIQSQVKFENKSSYLNSRISCTVEVLQENTQFSDSSLNSKLFTEANAIKRESLKVADTKYSLDRTSAYSKKSKEFARIAEVRAKETALAKTSAALSLASANYRKGFIAASELWKAELKKATTDRAAARLVAEENYLQLLEKSGVSIYPRLPAALVTPSPTPSVSPTPTPKPTATPTPSPTSTTNPQPTRQMGKVGTVYMASGSYFLTDATKLTLKQIALEINASGAKSILVYGHTDNRSGVNNTVLSQNRAKAVANYLRPLLTVKKISIGWYASKKPVAGGTSAAALAQNRRVEIFTK